MRNKISKSLKNTAEPIGWRLNRKVLAFFICLVIALVFWLLSALSKDYVSRVKLPVTYVNLPKDKIISSQLVSDLEFEVKSSGFRVLKFRYAEYENDELKIDAHAMRPYRNKGYYYIATNTRVEQLNAQLNRDIKILKVFPDTLFFNFSPKSVKSVPVKLNISLDFKNEFQLLKPITINPERVTLFGAANVLKKIEFVETEPIDLKKLDKTINKKVALRKTTEMNQLELSYSMVTINVPVAKFTEGTIDLPVVVENLPEGYSIKTFPDKAQLKYLVALEDLEKIKPEMFRIIADYSKVKDNSSKLKLELQKIPSNIKMVKINPEKVEYIIRK